MKDDYQYSQTPLVSNSNETFSFGGRSSSGLGLTVGSNPDGGSGGGGGGGRPTPAFFGFGPGGLVSGFFPAIPLGDSFIFTNNPVPSGSGNGIGQI